MYLINQRLEIAGRKIDRSDRVSMLAIKKDEDGDVDEKKRRILFDTLEYYHDYSIIRIEI